ncbi:Por secretion system C-terminal sorting domain-containing protein [Pseudarcicella hirudinis]|uniref:Por secretion system C-terminal sorting domain-containing protein n=2 Tax=Pseudarcicella hirudinis TaxID=1079859 RepID=A0A1I5UX24_9BACT|nr:Por secretion system C-terminal sorting domain-containing protein [Pseudarcicella hirudinis]
MLAVDFTVISQNRILPINQHSYSIQKAIPEHIGADIQQLDFSLNKVLLLKNRFPALSGKYIAIAQKEDSPDLNDIDLSGRIMTNSYSSQTITPHATMVAEVMAGSGVFSPFSEGVAPGLKIFPVGFSGEMPENELFIKQHLISVVNHSYGTEIENFYGKNAKAFDEQALLFPTLLNIFSSGNNGFSQSISGKYSKIDGMANLTGNFKMAKNILTVGAVNAQEELISFSSRGPAYDGRIKPEIVAFGISGTSEASAIVSGVTALLQELFSQENQVLPGSDLLKAVLINSAEDVGIKGIDHQTGFGNLNAFEAARTLVEKRYFSDKIIKGQVWEKIIEVPKGKSLKLTLVWNDLPAQEMNEKALINDLDMELIHEGVHWNPWVLSTFPHADSLLKPAFRGPDHLNNVEQISLENQDAGSYLIRINAGKISGEEQAFSIAFQWEESEQFEWTNPVSDSKLEKGTTQIIRWKNSFTTEKAKLEFSKDDGKSWVLISDEVPLQRGWTQWQCPDSFTTGIFRMQIGNHIYESAAFIISPAPAIHLQFVCADSIGISWESPNVSGAKTDILGYDPSSGVWAKIGATSDTSIVLAKQKDYPYLAIEPELFSGKKGLRSTLTDIQNPDVFCYYQNLEGVLTAEGNQVSIALINPEIVDRVIFMKQRNGEWAEFDKTSVRSDEKAYKSFDNEVNEGANLYQVRIIFKNGKEVISSVLTIFRFKDSSVFTFPNPVEKGQNLIFSLKEFDQYEGTIIDIQGKIVQKFNFMGDRFQIPVQLKEGSYFYQLDRNNHASLRAHFIVK